jgi:hypothetical protein
MDHVLELKQYDPVSILSVFVHPYQLIAIEANAYTLKTKSRIAIKKIFSSNLKTSSMSCPM